MLQQTPIKSKQFVEHIQVYIIIVINRIILRNPFQIVNYIEVNFY